MTEIARQKLSIAAKGRKLSDDHKKRISSAHVGKKKKAHNRITCPHCGITGGEGAIKRWHFDKCKSLKVNTVL